VAASVLLAPVFARSGLADRGPALERCVDVVDTTPAARSASLAGTLPSGPRAAAERSTALARVVGTVPPGPALPSDVQVRQTVWRGVGSHSSRGHPVPPAQADGSSTNDGT
jgi:hypothetical protein